MKMSLIMLTMFMISTKNPVKMSMGVMFCSLALFFMIWKKSSNSWIPLIMILLFTGGILIMFMILSSFQPNEAPAKMNFISGTMIIIIFMILTSTNILNNENNLEIQLMQDIKHFYQSLSSMCFLFSVILLYFYTFLKMLMKEQNTMRTCICQLKLNL